MRAFFAIVAACLFLPASAQAIDADGWVGVEPQDKPAVIQELDALADSYWQHPPPCGEARYAVGISVDHKAFAATWQGRNGVISAPEDWWHCLVAYDAEYIAKALELRTLDEATSLCTITLHEHGHLYGLKDDDPNVPIMQASYSKSILEVAPDDCRTWAASKMPAAKQPPAPAPKAKPKGEPKAKRWATIRVKVRAHHRRAIHTRKRFSGNSAWTVRIGGQGTFAEMEGSNTVWAYGRGVVVRATAGRRWTLRLTNASNRDRTIVLRIEVKQ